MGIIAIILYNPIWITEYLSLVYDFMRMTNYSMLRYLSIAAGSSTAR